MLATTTVIRPRKRVYSVSRVYADANEIRPKVYWDYDNLSVDWGTVENYEIHRKIGSGKYSNVFSGTNTLNDKACVIKVLKPVRVQKIHREIKILQNLTGGPHIVRLLDVVKDNASGIPGLVFERIHNVDFRLLYPTFTIDDVRLYFSQLLSALDYAHSMGIIHRDVKPSNVMIDPTQRRLVLIDWGLADFYHRGVNFNVSVASRHHKGPELLVNLQQYDYSLDLWAVGAMLAAIVFKKEPFFAGKSNTDQLVKIAQVMGTNELLAYCHKYRIRLAPEYNGVLGNYPKRKWSSFVTDSNRALSEAPHVIDLIDRLLRYNHQERLTAKEALGHGFFLI